MAKPGFETEISDLMREAGGWKSREGPQRQSSTGLYCKMVLIK